ncbi:MAG: 50S ribosomal protein L15 [Planctomycetota bacterium]|jgi:large subunit ribosomal protein L15
MMIHEITAQVGRHKARKRLGRGNGSGHGRTCGRGHKGARSRAGYSNRAYFEGGQMSFIRRLPKRGFTNAPFRQLYHVINLKTLEARLDDGADVSPKTLAAAGIIRDAKLPLKVLGEGELTKKFNVTAAKFSATAREKIEKAGGTVIIEARTKWTRAAAARAAAGDAPAQGKARDPKEAGGKAKKED